MTVPVPVNNHTKRNLLFTRVALAVTIPLIAVAIAWGALRQTVLSNVAELTRLEADKADVSVVDIQNTQTRNDISEIKATLIRIEAKLDSR